MKTKKQSRIDSIEKRIAAITNVTQKILNEISHLRELSIGTLELVKLMEGYDEALEKLQTKVTTKPKEEKKLDLDVE